MSLFGSLRTGVSGLSANSQRIAMISDNIANLNTYGYKRVDAQFSTFLTNSPSSTVYSSGGVITRANREISTQGSIEISNSSTDLAISGKGYFVVTDSLVEGDDGDFVASGTVSYTRSGRFRVDSEGHLRNSDGFYLLAWRRNAANTDFVQTSEISNFRAVNVANQNFQPVTTTELNIGANLTTSTAAGSGSAYTIAQTVIDRQGTARQIDITFEKRPPTSVRKTLHFSDGTGDPIEVNFNLPIEEHWRAYVRVENAQLIGYNTQGAERNSETGLVPIADLIFSSSGSLDTILQPGILESFTHTKLPISNGVLNEAGASADNPLDLTALTFAEQAGITDVLNRYDSSIFAGGFGLRATQIVTALRNFDADESPQAMIELYKEITSQTFVNGPARDAAGIPNAITGTIDDLGSFNVIIGENFGTPLLGQNRR